MRIVRTNDGNGDNLDRHFRELRNLEMQPSSDLWDKLEYRLDDERERIKHDHWYKALVMLLIPFTVINLLITYDLNVTESRDEYSFQQHSLFSTYDVPNNPNKPGGWGNFLNGVFLPDYNETTPKADLTEIIPLPSAGANYIHIQDEQAFESLAGAVNPGTPSLLERQMLETSATAGDVIKYHSRKIVDDGIASVKGFHIGIEGGINNSWMFYKEHANPTVGSNNSRKFGLTGTYGFSAGYDFPRFGIEAEWLMQSPQTQEFWELRYGKILLGGTVKLEYMHFPVMFKYKFTRIPSHSTKPQVLNLVTGFQYSRLRNMELLEEGLNMGKVSSLISTNELGLLAGLEYDIFLHKNYFLSIGIRASISTDAKAFPFVNSDTGTYNLLVGANASLNFLARRKGR